MSRFGDRVRFDWGREVRVEMPVITLTLALDGTRVTSGYYEPVFADPALAQRLLRQQWDAVLSRRDDRLREEWEATPGPAPAVGV